MTDQEIIEIIRVERTCVERNSAGLNCNRDCGHCDLLKQDNEILEAYNMAISALEEIRQYRALGTVEELREARKKQVSKKPKTILRHRGGFEMAHCPNCDTDYQVNRRYTINDDYCSVCGKLLDSSFKSFCGNCGQAIDWE